jgi:hypothetical protein
MTLPCSLDPTAFDAVLFGEDPLVPAPPRARPPPLLSWGAAAELPLLPSAPLLLPSGSGDFRELLAYLGTSGSALFPSPAVGEAPLHAGATRKRARPLLASRSDLSDDCSGGRSDEDGDYLAVEDEDDDDEDDEEEDEADGGRRVPRRPAAKKQKKTKAAAAADGPKKVNVNELYSLKKYPEEMIAHVRRTIGDTRFTIAPAQWRAMLRGSGLDDTQQACAKALRRKFKAPRYAEGTRQRKREASRTTLDAYGRLQQENGDLAATVQRLQHRVALLERQLVTHGVPMPATGPVRG